MRARFVPWCCVSLLALCPACGSNAGSSSGPSAEGGAGSSGTAVAAGGGASNAGASNGTAGGSATGGTVGSGGSSADSSGGGAGHAGSSAGNGGAADDGGAAGGTVGFQRPLFKLPNNSYPSSMVNVSRENWKMDLLSPTMNDKKHHNFPLVVNGALLINGNEEFFYWDITDPTNPKELSQFNTPNRCATCGGKGEGEAESQDIAIARYGDKFYEVTTSGYGVDIWNITDPVNVVHLKSVKLQGVDYGDFTSAVWGLYWQGDTIYIGGTDTGLHILDAHDPNNVTFVKRIPTSAFGGINAGPVFAVGNILIITTPKENGGIATLDISDPQNPITLAAIKPPKSYIGGFYRHYVFLQTPLRAWDVLTDPTNIGTATTPIGSITTPASEYMSFGDDYLFLGHLRPDPGASKIDISDPKHMAIKSRVWGRLDIIPPNTAPINDDQFPLAIGPLLVLGDDQAPYRGSVIAVHSTTPDTKPPEVDTIIPRDKSTSQATTSRIGISFTDNIELATVNAASFIVRPVGGQPIAGKWGLSWTVLNFDPDQALAPATTYEVILPKGGITDLVGNAVAEFKSTFTTK